MYNLNILKFGMYKPTSISNICSNLAQAFRNLKYCYQRATKGFCDADVWDLSDYYSSLLANSIEYFKDHLHSYPSELTEESWDNYLAELSEHFKKISEDYYTNEFKDEFLNLSNVFPKLDECANDYNEEQVKLRTKVFVKYIERGKEIEDMRRAELIKGLDMLKEHFFDLWD